MANLEDCLTDKVGKTVKLIGNSTKVIDNDKMPKGKKVNFKNKKRNNKLIIADSLSPYKLVFDINENWIQKLKLKYEKVDDHGILKRPLVNHGMAYLSNSCTNLGKHNGS